MCPSSLDDASSVEGVARGDPLSGRQPITEALEQSNARASLLHGLRLEIEEYKPAAVIVPVDVLNAASQIIDVERLHAMFHEFPCAVHGYLQRPDDWFESYYKALVTGGWTPESRTIGALVGPISDMWLAFDQRLYPWTVVFGAGNVMMHAYENANARPGGLIGDFLEHIGFTDLAGVVEAETSLSDEVPGRLRTEIVRIFNRLNHASETWRDDLATLGDDLAVAGIPHDNERLLSPTSRRAIIELWRPRAQRMADMGLLSAGALHLLTALPKDHPDWEPIINIPATAIELIFVHSTALSARQTATKFTSRKRGTQSLNAELGRLRNDLKRLRGTHSWRITAPARKWYGRLRNLGHAVR